MTKRNAGRPPTQVGQAPPSDTTARPPRWAAVPHLGADVPVKVFSVEIAST
jgi:hypothetical protein